MFWTRCPDELALRIGNQIFLGGVVHNMQVRGEIVLRRRGRRGCVCWLRRLGLAVTRIGRPDGLVGQLDDAVDQEGHALLQVLPEVPGHAACGQAVNLQGKVTVQSAGKIKRDKKAF